MSKTTTVDGFTYSDQRFAELAIKSLKITSELRRNYKLIGYKPVPNYRLETGNRNSRLGYNGLSRLLDVALKLDNMSGRGITRKRERERFIAQRDAASATAWKCYSKLQGAVDIGILLDHGGDTQSLAFDVADNISVDSGQQYSSDEISGGWMDDSSDYEGDDTDPTGRTFSNGSGFNPGVFYDPKRSRKSEVVSIDPATVEYTGRPSNMQEDSIFSRVDGVVGGRRVSTIGTWSTKPSDNLPNPVRDRAVARDARYLLGGRAWPADGYHAGWMPKNGLNFDHRGVCGTVEMVIKHCGARAQLFYLHKNPLSVGWMGTYNIVEDSRLSGVPVSGHDELVGAVGVNCTTVGMPGWIALNTIEE
jgi:hypothetical protein